jgi:pimeloyl-ACP methyl ester carboxylesterase
VTGDCLAAVSRSGWPRSIARLVLAASLLLAVSLPASAASPTSLADEAGPIDIGGRKILVECRGTGSPTVVLIAGYRNNGEIWTVEPAPGRTAVFSGVAKFTRVCAYDRPGTLLDQTHLSRSDPVPMPRAAEDIASELHVVLAKMEASLSKPGTGGPPYVLVGHSLGGLFARLYAGLYPNEVAGLVLVDAYPESMTRHLGPAQWAAYTEIAKAPIPGLDYPALELVDFDKASAVMSTASAAQPLKKLPLFVISRGKPVALPRDVPQAFSPQAFEQAWRIGQDELAGLLPDARHMVASESDHYVQIAQPELVVDAVRAVVQAVRDPTSWTR